MVTTRVMRVVVMTAASQAKGIKIRTLAANLCNLQQIKCIHYPPSPCSLQAAGITSPQFGVVSWRGFADIGFWPCHLVTAATKTPLQAARRRPGAGCNTAPGSAGRSTSASVCTAANSSDPALTTDAPIPPQTGSPWVAAAPRWLAAPGYRSDDCFNRSHSLTL